MLRDVDDFLADRMDRRQLLRGGAGLALGVGLAGCGVGDSGSGSKEDTEKVVKAKVDGDLVYFNWSEYLDPELIKAFEKKYDVKVRQSNFDSMASMLAKLRSGNRYDIIFPDQSVTPRLIALNQLLKLDHEQLKNYDQVFEFFHDPVYDPGSAHTVPYGMYATGVIWREDKISGMTGSWNDLFREDAKGKIYVLDDFQEAIGMANYVNGYELNEYGDEELDTTKQTLIDQKPLLRGYSTDDVQNMLNGNAWIHHGWNGDVVNVRNQADDPSIYKFEKCKEGIPVGADTMAIPANAEHPGTAMLFIDFMLDPENAAQNVGYFGYPMPNNGAVDAFKELAQDDPAITVTTEDLERGDQFAPLAGERRRAWDRVWTEVKAA
jgi:spermidine/putrescine transport system substrate-binding protein